MNQIRDKELSFKVKALQKFVLENKIDKVKSIVDSIPDFDLANALLKWDNSSIISLFEIIEPSQASELLYEFNAKQIMKLIQSLSLKELTKIFNEFYIDEIVNILENQPSSITKKIYSILNKETIGKIEDYKKYPINSAGYNMTVDYIKIYDDVIVQRALEDIKRQVSKNDAEIAGYVFVVDSMNNLKGFVRSEILISASRYELVKNLVEETPFVFANDSLETVKQVVEDNEQSFIPVVNEKEKLLGVIGAEDFISNIVSVPIEAIGEGKVIKSTKPYIQQTAWDLFQSRIFWIILLLIFGSITQIMIIGFQLIWQNNGLWSYNNAATNAAISSIITLGFATSISVASSINDSSGNAGSQTSSTIIRAIATNEIDSSMYGKVIRKEVYAGVIIGFTTAVTSMIRMWVVWGIMGQFSDITTLFEFYWYFIISLIAAISFFVAIIIGNFVGAILPIAADKFGKDATLFSGPLQTTIVDLITFMVYLSLTTIVFVLSADSINDKDPNVVASVMTLKLSNTW